MTSPASNEETIFNRAAALPPAERAAFLERECAGNATLRALVETLLRAHGDARSFLENPAPEIAATAIQEMVRREEKPGGWIGRYKLLQLIGEGGCGSVYLAEQEEPVRRRVALKVIKLGMDTKSVIARFEAERQALALMDHPNIAKVLDAGATETGRPFFVMELVRGVPITKYCDENNLKMPARLALFSQVCHALQHAHQKGIIHRDVKPSNILVTLHDGEPMPKVIDFGIAKATQGRLTDQTLFTALEQFIGTPAYMSPEQAEMSALDVDTRSDIYSLGVLLYELLTGHPPFDPKTFVSAGLDEMRRIIREVEPPRPSSRLSTLPDADRSTVARLRGSVPAQLSTQLSGDLDWIVMKALDKNRTRRYESASAFAADIQRYLHHEPVIARPPSTTYLLQKLVRRHKVGVATGSAVAAALLIGLGVATWSFLQERAARERAVAAEQEQAKLRAQAELARNNEAQQRQQAEAARERAVAAEHEQTKLRELAENQRARAEQARNAEAEQRRQAEANEKKAKLEAKKRDQAFEFMRRMLGGVGPSVAAGRDTTLLREILDKTIGKLDRELKDNPETELVVRASLVLVYVDLGEFAKAEEQALIVRKKSPGVFDSDREEAALGELALGAVRLAQGRSREAEELLRAALAVTERSTEKTDRNLAQAYLMVSVALLAQGKTDEAERHLRTALAYSAKGAADAASEDYSFGDAIRAYLSQVLLRQGKLDEADALAREMLAAAHTHAEPDPRAIGNALAVRCMVLLAQGRAAEAEPLAAEAIGSLQKAYGPEHREIASLLNVQASLAEQTGKLKEAESFAGAALAMQKKIYGEAHPNLTNTTLQLERIRRKLGQTDSSADLQRTRDSTLQRAFGREDLAAASAKIERAGDLVSRQRNYVAAEALLREALPIVEQVLGPSHPSVINARLTLLNAVSSQERMAEAEALARELVQICRATLGQRNAPLAQSLLLAARAQHDQGKLAEAEATLREALPIMRELAAGGRSPDIAFALLALVTVKAHQGDPVETARAVREAAEASRSLPASQREGMLNPMFDTIDLLRRQNKRAAAEAVTRALLDVLQLRGDGETATRTALSLRLALILGADGRPAEAEAVAREAWEMRKKVLPAKDWQVAAARGLLGQTLLAGGKHAEAASTLEGTWADLQANRPASVAPGWRNAANDAATSLIRLYEAIAEPAKAAEWKAKLAALNAAAAQSGPASGAGADLGALVARSDWLKQQGKYAEAEPVERRMLELAREREGVESRLFADYNIKLAQTLNILERFADAEPLARTALSLREKLTGPTSWNTASARAALGRSLQGQKKFADAEPVLLQAYADLQRESASIPAAYKTRLPETARFLAELYSATGALAQAAEWKAKAGAEK